MPNMKYLVTLATISSLGVFAGSLIAPIETRYIQSITNDSFLTGSVFGIGSLFFALLSIYIGRWSDVVGRKKVILFGLIIGAIYALLYSFVLNIFQLYGIKFAWAFSAVAMGPVLSAYVQDFLESSRNKGRYFGYIYSLQSISGSFGAFVGGYVAEKFDITAPLLILSATYVVMALLTFFILPREFDVIKQKNKKQRSVSEIVKFIINKPELLFYLSLNTSYSINWGIKSFLWPLAIFSIAQNDLITGSIFATMGMVAFFLLPFAGNIVDHYGPFKVSFFQFILLGSMGIAIATTESLTWFWVFACLYTIGEVLNVSQMVLFTENVQKGMRGSIVGFDSALDQLLAVAAPFLAGSLIVIFDVQKTLIVFASLYWISIIISGFIYWRSIRG